jgi:hypothetical protein
VTREPTANPDALDALHAAVRASLRCVALAALVFVALAQCGCGGGAGAMTGMASVVKTTLDVMRQTRAVLCVTALDPLLGDPRADQPTWTTKDASTAADAAGD